MTVATATPDLEISSDGRTVTVTVPIAFKSRRGRKLMIALDGHHLTPTDRRCARKPLAKAFRHALQKRS